VRCCINPAHLEPVTAEENNRRSRLATKHDACPKGHPFTPENTIVEVKQSTGRPYRKCRICTRTRAHEQRRVGAETIFQTDDSGVFRYRGTFYGTDPESFRKLKALFASDPSSYARDLEKQIDAALAKHEKIMIEEAQ
jgi:hypothetical protein